MRTVRLSETKHEMTRETVMESSHMWAQINLYFKRFFASFVSISFRSLAVSSSWPFPFALTQFVVCFKYKCDGWNMLVSVGNQITNAHINWTISLVHKCMYTFPIFRIVCSHIHAHTYQPLWRMGRGTEFGSNYSFFASFCASEANVSHRLPILNFKITILIIWKYIYHYI